MDKFRTIFEILVAGLFILSCFWLCAYLVHLTGLGILWQKK